MFLDTTLILLRHIIDDTNNEDYEYSDDRLIELIYIGATYVNIEIGTSSTYTIDICLQTITPEPDNTFCTLVALKCACLLVRSTQNSYAKCDFRVTDGPSSVDLKDAANKLKVAADSFCNQYERAKLSYLMGDGGYVITTPSSNC